MAPLTRIVLLTFAVIAGMVAPSAAADRPNVVLIITDDAGYDDYGFSGRGVVPTPNLDAIAEGGVAFTNGYVTAAVCSPSRAGLLTARYQQRFGHEFNLAGRHEDAGLGLPAEETTVAEAMRDAGYATALVGKWHLGAAEGLRPFEQGFDRFLGTVRGSRSYFAIEPTERAALTDRADPIDEPEGLYLTDWIGEQTVGLIREHADRPFFVVASFTAPHTPMHATDEDLRRAADALPGETERRVTYAAMVAALDRAVGDILDTLDAEGLADRTIVALVNDNGGATNNGSDNGHLRGMKGSKWEGGVRVPMAMRWPGVITPGVRYHHPVLSIDLAATFAAAAGASFPAYRPRYGVDLRPFFEGDRAGPPRDRLYWRRGVAAAVRADHWKLIRSEGNPTLLFDLYADPSERRNLAEREPDVTAALLRDLEAWEATLAEPRWDEGEKWRRNQVLKHRMSVIGREAERDVP